MAMPTVPDQLNLQDADSVCAVFHAAAEVARQTPGRNGATVDLPAKGRLLATGDMHDHLVNCGKAVRLARLDDGEDRHLLLQELIHGERLINGMDFSYRLAARAALLQTRYPNQVHVLLSNHELGQVIGEDLRKHGNSLLTAFHAGLEYVFGDDAERVHQALEAWVRTMPLAVRCANGVMLAHSLPATRNRQRFEPTVIDRPLEDADLQPGVGSAHQMVWGRNFHRDWAQTLAEAWGVELFVLGHQYVDMGYELQGDRLLVINSDHDHGVAVPIDLAKRYTRAELVDEVLPLAGVFSEA
jgi:hypothetical protein